MPRHGSRLQLDGSTLLTPGAYNDLDHFLCHSFADLLKTEHAHDSQSYHTLGIYLEDMQLLRDMLNELSYYWDEDEDCEEYKGNEAWPEDWDMFEEYKASEHCSTHSSPEAQDALMERSGGYVFFFGEVYSLGWEGRRWAYRCELEDTLQQYEDRLCEYRKYCVSTASTDGLTTATP